MEVLSNLLVLLTLCKTMLNNLEVTILHKIIEFYTECVNICPSITTTIRTKVISKCFIK
jgi:hypothetical protein